MPLYYTLAVNMTCSLSFWLQMDTDNYMTIHHKGKITLSPLHI